MAQKTLREWQAAYKAGEFSFPDKDTQIAAGWVDWFCDDSALLSKTKSFAGVITRMKSGGKVDLDAAHAVFKNCQRVGQQGTYDLMIVYNDASEALYSCTSGENIGDGLKWHLYDHTSGAKVLVSGYGSVIQMVKWLNDPIETIEIVKFPVNPSATNAAIWKMAEEDVLERFEVEQEFSGICRKTFREAGQGDEWLDRELLRTEQGTVLVAIYNGEATAGYEMKP